MTRDLADAHSGFRLRGIKGWAWSPEQYLTEIPFMAGCGLNFLMNDYGSLWDLGTHGNESGAILNFWYRPFSPKTKHSFATIIRTCRRYGIEFCFSMNPNLKSDRPFDYSKPEDLEALWQHYTWAQGLGVKWFNISLDDITRKIDAAGQASLVNNIFQRLRASDPAAQFVFCPTWYAGTGASGVESNTTLGNGDTPGVRYTRTLAAKLHPEVFLFWTGPQVCSLTIEAGDAKLYKDLCGHRVLLWDNYPVNDHNPTLHLGPVTGRSWDLCNVVDGFMSNPMYESQANRIPLLTIADYLRNPRSYDPIRSIRQSIAHLGRTLKQRRLLLELVELYPGRLWDKSEQTGWNSLLARFREFHAAKENERTERLIGKAARVHAGIPEIFPDDWLSGCNIVGTDLERMKTGRRQI